MFYVKQSESTADRRRVPILMVDETDGSTPETGLTLYGLLSKNGNTFAATAGTFAEAGYGQYYYQFTTGEIDSLGYAGIHVTASGARNYDAIIHVTAYDAYSGSFIAPTDVWNANISSITSAGTAGSQLNLVASGGAGITSGDVWNYDISGITGAGTAGSQVNAAASGGAGITAGDVWEYDISAISGAGTAGSQVNVAAAGGGTTSGDIATAVWDYNYFGDVTGQTLVDAKTYANYANQQTLSSAIATAVWEINVETTGIATTTIPYPLGYIVSASNGATTAAEQVWNYDISAISGAGLAGTQLNLAAAPGAGGGITAGDVWNYTLSNATTADATVTLTQTYAFDAQTYASNAEIYSNNAQNNTTTNAIRAAVWDFDAPNTGVAGTTIPYPLGYLIQAGEGVTTAGNQVWNYDISAISGAGLAGTQLNIAASGTTLNAPSEVWSYATREITGGLANTVTTITNPVEVSTAAMAGIANTVWSTLTAPYTTHATFGHNLLRSDNAATIGEVTLHQSGGSKRVDADVHAFVNNTASATAMLNILTGIGASMTTNITGNLSGSVGSVTSNVNVSTASMSGIANTVWSTDISTYATAGTAGSQLNLAALPSGAGVTAGDVWSYATREITGGTVDNVTNDVNVSTASMSGIANTVWSVDVSGYTSPSAGYDLSNATAGGGITAGDVWNYSGSYAPGTSGDALNTAATDSAIAAAGVTSNAPVEVWSYATRTLTSGGGSGITAGDVWDYATRTITGGSIDTNNDKTGYSLSSTQAFDVTGNITGNVSGSVGSVTNPVDITTNAMSGTAGSVWSYVTRTLTSGSGLTAGDVWTYATRTTTGGTVTDVTNPVAVSTTSMSGIAGTVWSAATRTITGGTITTNSDKTGYSLSGTQSFNLTGNITGNVSGSVGSVTSAVTVATASMTGIAGTVWSNATRTITGGTITTVSDKTGYSLSGTQSFNLTGNITGSVSGSVGSVTGSVGSVVSPVTVATASMSGIANTVWSTNISSYTSPSAGYSLYNATAGGGITAGDVWSYATRTLTSGGAGITAGDVWSYVLSNTDSAETNLVTAAGGAGITAGDVWTYVTREITGGVIDTNNDKTDYALSTAGVNAVQSGLSTVTTAQVGQEVDASLLDVGLTSVITGRIDAAVSSRLATSSYVTPPTTAAIATSVWTAATRTLTSGAGATAGDVWTYNIAGITSSGSAGAQLNDASVSGSVVTVVNGPYKLTSIAEGVDGRIDILADSVQTIQLNCLDGFGAPFNIVGYTSVVNVYDVSGALAETYTPTVDFAQNGILSFDIDTVITGTTGRYTLVVELTAGAEVIQLGPLEVLVRPL
jgi:hypothetical protein